MEPLRLDCILRTAKLMMPWHRFVHKLAIISHYKPVLSIVTNTCCNNAASYSVAYQYATEASACSLQEL